MLFVFLTFIILVFSSKSIRENIYVPQYLEEPGYTMCTAILMDDLLSIYESGFPSYNALNISDEKCQFQDAVDWQMLYDFTEQNIFEKESYGNQWRERSFKAGFQMEHKES